MSQLSSIEDVKTFVLAGNSRFTIVSRKSGTRFTYRVRASDNRSVFFVSALTGADNESAYSFFATIFPDGLRFGRKSKLAESAPSVAAFRWFYGAIAAGVLPDTVEFYHEGRCGRCGRALTVPESIASGIGPECASRMAA